MDRFKRRPIKILVQRADKLGDVVLSLPVIEQLKQAYPACEIYFLTSEIGAAFLNAHPLVKRVMTVPGFKLSLLRDYITLVKSIRFDQYDVYISLWNNPWMAWLGKLAGIPVRIGDSSNPSLAHCYNHPVFQDWQNFTRHQVEFNLDLLKPISTTIFDPVFRIPVDPDIEKKVRHELASLTRLTEKKVAIFVGTGGTNYPIPEAALTGFIERLGTLQHYKIILCGQVESTHPLVDFQRSYVINKLNQTSLGELMAIIQESDYYIGSDTGPTHIASFLNKPILFFSPIKPNPPLRWGPWSDQFVILRREYVCPRFCNALQCRPSCFGYVTASLLMDVFNQLVYQVTVEGPLSTVQKKRAHLLHSIRVLYLVKSDRERALLRPVIERFREQGLVIFVEKAPSFWRLSRWVIHRNINVLQGHVSWRHRMWIRFYIGLVKQYIVPIYVTYPIRDFVTLTDYISIYQANWNFRQK